MNKTVYLYSDRLQEQIGYWDAGLEVAYCYHCSVGRESVSEMEALIQLENHWKWGQHLKGHGKED